MKHQFIQTVLFLLQTLVLLVGLAACAVTTSSVPDLTPVTVQLRWTHQAQFIGFYATDQNGYYAEEGLTVTFLEGGPQVVFHAMMSHVGITPDQYTQVNLDNDLSAFQAGQFQVLTTYLTNRALTLQQAGEKMNIIYPDDYGVHFYTDTIFATDDFIAENPGLTQRFLRATLKGWTYVIENPDKAGPMVRAYNPEADPVLETTKVVVSIPLVNTGVDHIGWMQPEVWAGMEQTLREQGVLTAIGDIAANAMLSQLVDDFNFDKLMRLTASQTEVS